MTDRRRINGPANGTQPAVFENKSEVLRRPQRLRQHNELRRIFLQTGLVPAAAGSAYLELESPKTTRSFVPTSSTIKLSCTIQGPKPLPRNANFSPNLQVTSSVKFMPFASRQRRGYIRDNVERDLGSHLENALSGVILTDKYPKSALEIAVIVLEGEEDCLWNEEQGQETGLGGIGLMNVLSASINVAVAALIDAKIECLDILSAGVAARDTSGILLDPCPSEHEELTAACVLGFLSNKDELVEVWSKTTAAHGSQKDLAELIDSAVKAARGAQKILVEVTKESLESKSLAEYATTAKNTNNIARKT